MSNLPEPSWTGVPENGPVLYRKFVKNFIGHDIGAEAVELEISLRDQQESVSQLRGQLRRCKLALKLNEAEKLRNEIRLIQANIREGNAKLASLKKAHSAVPELADIEHDYHFMVSELPGFLGIRFDHTSMIVHVRSSFLYYGSYYDMGDYEVVLYTDHTPLAIQLRRSPALGSNPYWDDRDRVEDGFGLYTRGSFCFGHRANHISELYDSANFGHCLSVLVDSLNSLNPDDIDSTIGYLKMVVGGD